MTEFDSSIGSSSPQLDDGGHYSMLGLVALKTGTAKITANSSYFDPVVIVEKLNNDGSIEVVGQDDDGGGGTDSKLTLNIVSGTHYNVLVTTPQGDPSGLVAIHYQSDALSPDGRGLHTPPVAAAERK